MNVADAACHVMQQGRYTGHQIGKVGADDDGLIYLEWLAGQDWVEGVTRIALEAYVTDRVIYQRLRDLKDRSAAEHGMSLALREPGLSHE